MSNYLEQSLEFRLIAGRIVGLSILVLGLLLTAAGLVRPAAAATEHASARCISDLARVERDISIWVGGDHVQYDFGRRVMQTASLCQSGQIREARNLLAEIKSDVRALRGERWER